MNRHNTGLLSLGLEAGFPGIPPRDQDILPQRSPAPQATTESPNHRGIVSTTVEGPWALGAGGAWSVAEGRGGVANGTGITPPSPVVSPTLTFSSLLPSLPCCSQFPTSAPSRVTYIHIVVRNCKLSVPGQQQRLRPLDEMLIEKVRTQPVRLSGDFNWLTGGI